MKIRIDPHTLVRSEERGVTEEEIREVLETGDRFGAMHGRLGKTKVFPFQAHRLGRFYEEKRVEVIYAQEGDTVVTVTVYAFYGKWEEKDESFL